MEARQVLLGVQGIRMGGLLYRRQAPAMAIMASVATVVCCGLMRQDQVSQVRGTVSLQQSWQGEGPGAWAPAVDVLPPRVLHAAHQAYVEGVKDGERHVEEMREPRRVSANMLYSREMAGRDVSDAAIRWVRKWEGLGAEAIKSGALGRLKSKQELLLGLQASADHGDQGDVNPQRFFAMLLPSWRQFAFRPVDVPTRSRMSQLDLIRLADKTKEDHEKEKVGEERGVSKDKEEHDADKALEAYYTQQAARDHVYEHPGYHKEHETRTLSEYYAVLKKRDTVLKSHLAVPEDPKQYAVFEHEVSKAYFNHPHALYKMFYAAEHHDMKTAAEEYKKIYLPQTRKQGALFPSHPAETGANDPKVDAAKEGNA